MQNVKKQSRAEHPSTPGMPGSSSGSKLPQNYTKFLYNLVSNSQIPHHKRNNSDYIYAQSKLTDKSALDRSTNNQSINYNSSSKSPIPSTRYQNIMVPQPKDSSVIIRKSNMTNISVNQQTNPSNTSHILERSAIIASMNQRPSHSKQPSIDNSVNLDTSMKKDGKTSSTKKISSATPYFKLVSNHRKSSSIQLNQRPATPQLESKKNSVHSIANDISSIMGEVARAQGTSGNHLNQKLNTQHSNMKTKDSSENTYKPNLNSQNSHDQSEKAHIPSRETPKRLERANSNTITRKKQVINPDEEILSKFREQLKANYAKVESRMSHNRSNSGLDVSRGNATNVSNINMKNISYVDQGVPHLRIEKEESPRSNATPKKVINSSALQSIYKKVGKFLNKSSVGGQLDISQEKKGPMHINSEQEDPENPSAKHSRKASQVSLAQYLAAENEKTIKPYLNMAYEEQPPPEVQYKRKNSRDTSPHTHNIQIENIINSNNYMSNHKPEFRDPRDQEKRREVKEPSIQSRLMAKRLADIVEPANSNHPKYIHSDMVRVDDKKAREKSASRDRPPTHDGHRGEGSKSYIVVEENPEERRAKSPAFFKGPSHSPKPDSRNASPYDPRRRESSPIIQEPSRHNSSSQLFHLDKKAYINPSRSPIRENKKTLNDESRNSSQIQVTEPSKPNESVKNANQAAQISNQSSKPNHKKNSKSVNSITSLDILIKGLNLPINTNKLNKENVMTPNVSEPNSANNSMVNLNQNQNVQSNNQLKPAPAPVTEEDLNDDEVLKDRLVKIIRENFKSKGCSPSTTLDYYRLIKMIGKGAFGKVYLGVHLLTGKHVAIKSIEKACMKDEASRRKVFQEVLILRKTNHRNVVRLLEVFENKRYLFMVLEYASRGDLLTLVKKRSKLPEEEAKKIFIQLVAGIRYCHHSLILHRDVKLDNILIDELGVVKICDFGVSRFVKKGQVINEQCGTPAYIAPEIIKDEGYEGCYADIWSMGVLLYAMVTGTVPFKANNLEELHDAILAGEYGFPDYLSHEVKDLIWRMLKLNPYARIGIDDMADHPWLKDAALESVDDKFPIADTRSSGSMERTMKKSYSLEQGSTIQIVEPVIRKMEELGFMREFVIKSINLNSCNHAAACYYLLYKEYLDGGAERI